MRIFLVNKYKTDNITNEIHKQVIRYCQSYKIKQKIFLQYPELFPVIQYEANVSGAVKFRIQ